MRRSARDARSLATLCLAVAALAPVARAQEPVRHERPLTLDVRVSPREGESGAARTLTVTARRGRAVAERYRGTVRFGSSDPLATLPPDYTFTAADRGTHTFSATFRSDGPQSLTVLDVARPGVLGCAGLVVTSRPTPPARVARFAYVASEGDDSVIIYIIDPQTGDLRPYDWVPLSVRPTGKVFVHPSGRLLLVPGTSREGLDGIAAYRIDPHDGRLVEVAGSPFHRGARPIRAVALHPAGGVLYAVRAGADDDHWVVVVFAIDATTGALRRVQEVAAPASSEAIAVGPSGRRLFVAQAEGGVSLYRIDPVTGRLALTARSALRTGAGARDVAVDPRGRFVLVANHLSNQVSVWVVGSAGGLTPAPGSPFAAGAAPASVAIQFDSAVVYVANQGSGDISAFAVGPDGALEPVGDAVDAGDGLRQVVVDASGRFLHAVSGAARTVSTYAIDPASGALAARRSVAARGSPVALAITSGEAAVTFMPTFAYVANESEGISPSVTGYVIDDTTGVLTPLPGSPFLTADASAVAVTPAGTFAYVAQARFDAIAVFSVGTSGALVEVAGARVAAGRLPLAIAVEPSGRFAYALNQGSQDVSAYRIDASTGRLTPIPGSPFSVGSLPFGLAIDPLGRFAFVSSWGDDDVHAFVIDATTGALVPAPGSPFATGPAPLPVAASPSGLHVYVGNVGDNSMSVYAVEPTTGALAPVAGSPFPLVPGPSSIAFDPMGRFAYVASVYDRVAVYEIAPTSGAPAEVAGSPFTAGDDTYSISVEPSGRFVYAANQRSNDISGYRIDTTTGALTGLEATTPTRPTPVWITTVGRIRPQGAAAPVAAGRLRTAPTSTPPPRSTAPRATSDDVSLRLANGRVVTGRIVKMTADAITLEVADGRGILTFPRASLAPGVQPRRR